ncbi:hypothetical protein OAQ99_04805 [Candidatus Kapabacteria bacterium]|nr:hypothetical protein [Candidatus Kapabacteria bacterium]
MSLHSQSWELDCPTEDCYDNENIPWNYVNGIDPSEPKYYYNGISTQSPGCWIQVDYRWRNNSNPPCEDVGCEIEILNILISGDCFYSFTDGNGIVWPPVMDISGSTHNTWVDAMFILLKNDVIPCLDPGPDNCVTVNSFKSATCKKIELNPDGTRLITYCEPNNSCCLQEITVCKDNNGTSWNITGPQPVDNCHLNNDPDCEMSCAGYGSEGWILPKSTIKNETLKSDSKLYLLNNSVHYENIEENSYLIVTNMFGNVLYEGNISETGEIKMPENENIIVAKLSSRNNKSFYTFKLIEK